MLSLEVAVGQNKSLKSFFFPLNVLIWRRQLSDQVKHKNIGQISPIRAKAVNQVFT